MKTMLTALELNPEATLHTLAELGVALAGFVALVALFSRGRDGSWSPQVLSAVRYMIELSLVLLVFGLVPFPLAFLGLFPETVWVVSSAALLLVWAVLLMLYALRMRALLASSWRPRTFLYHGVGFLLGLAGLLMNLVNVIGARGPALYVGSLVVLVILVALPFLALVTGAGRDAG